MRLATDPFHDYLRQLVPSRSEAMQRIRTCVKQLWPSVLEDMSYGIPTFLLDGKPLFAMANQKHAVVFYVIPYDLLDVFKHELLLYNCGKSCIRLRDVDEPALALLDRVIRFVGATHNESKLRLKPVMRTMHKRKASPIAGLS